MGILGICLADGRLHGQLGEPIHGGQAALQLRRHGDHRLGRKGGGEKDEAAVDAAGAWRLMESGPGVE